MIRSCRSARPGGTSTACRRGARGAPCPPACGAYYIILYYIILYHITTLLYISYYIVCIAIYRRRARGAPCPPACGVYYILLLSRKKRNTRSRHPHAMLSSEIQTISEPRPEIETRIRRGLPPSPTKKTRKKNPLKKKTVESTLYSAAVRQKRRAVYTRARTHTQQEKVA